MAALGVAEAYLLPPRVREFFVGATVASTVWLLWGFLVLWSGSINLWFGNQGEGATRNELKKLRRHKWHLIQGIQFSDGDVDAIVVGPGGVVAVETKWRNGKPKEQFINGDRQQLAKSATVHARDLRVYLESKGLKMAVLCAVAVWGSAAASLSNDGLVIVNGTPLMHGNVLKSWVRSLPSTYSPGEIRATTELLHRRLAEQTKA